MLDMARKKRTIVIPTPDQIRAVRGDRTQSEVAEIVGVRPNVWSLWEAGKRVPSRQSAILINLLKLGKIK